jgi:hypothetical protein
MSIKKTLFLFSFFLCSITVWTQTYSISGTVKDTANETVAFANILVMQSRDSTVVTGTSSDENGFFKMEDLASDKYIIKTSFIGFKDDFKTLNLTEDIDNINVVL